MSRILYVQYTNPAGYPPLQHSSRILADAGWRVLFLGTGAAGSNALAFPEHANISVRKMEFCAGGWRQKLHFLTYCLWVFWTVLKWRPDWVYASDPLSCPAALPITWIPGIRVLYHEHDAPGREPGSNRFLQFIARMRRDIARRADLCVLPNAVRLARFQRECGPVRNSVCVWNCPAVSDVEPTPRNPPTDSVWILYHGSIVPDRLPGTVVDALGLLPSFVKLRVTGYETVGSKGYCAELRSRAEKMGIADRIEFLNPIPQRADLLRTTAQSDIGLALMPMHTTDPNCQSMTGASNKVFDYMACGLGLIVSDLPDWREMFVDEGYAVACNPNDAGSIAAAINSFLDDLTRLRAAGEAGRQRIGKSWNYENQFRPVFELMSAPAGGRTGLAPQETSREKEPAL